VVKMHNNFAYASNWSQADTPCVWTSGSTYISEVDEIYNLACPASPVHYQFDPVQTTKTSVMGAINMLGMAKRLKVKILQASTSEIYVDPDVHTQGVSA
ncbi:unnamed protein product, partial [marine sediment metagenome]